MTRSIAGISILATMGCFMVTASPVSAETDAQQPLHAEVVVDDSIIDPRALTFERGRFGTTINGQTFQYPTITSLRGWQYATWFDGERRLCVGRRRLPDGEWQRIAFNDYRIDHVDVHNVAVIGICPLDGTIHLSFDHHVDPLRYRVSRAGVATEPESVEWSAALFGPTVSELVEGHTIERVTYPGFFTTPEGRLQLYYRIGGSGRGDSYLAEYDPRNGGWTELGMFVSRDGEFQGSDSRNAYHNGFDYDAQRRLHTTWTWRELRDNFTPQGGLLNCHGLMYAWSDDAGRTWRNNAGEAIGVTGRDPIHVASTSVTVVDLPYKWGIMNTVTQTVDSRGRVHVVMWQQPPDAPAGSSDKNTWRYLHYWRDIGGQWHQRQLPFVGRKPTLHADAQDNLYLVFTKGDSADYRGRDPGGRLHIARATADSGGATAGHSEGWSDWSIIWDSSQRFSGEPRVDQLRWAAEGVLSVYVQEHPAELGQPSALHAIDFRFPDTLTAPINADDQPATEQEP